MSPITCPWRRTGVYERLTWRTVLNPIDIEQFFRKAGGGPSFRPATREDILRPGFVTPAVDTFCPLFGFFLDLDALIIVFDFGGTRDFALERRFFAGEPSPEDKRAPDRRGMTYTGTNEATEISGGNGQRMEQAKSYIAVFDATAALNATSGAS